MNCRFGQATLDRVFASIGLLALAHIGQILARLIGIPLSPQHISPGLLKAALQIRISGNPAGPDQGLVLQVQALLC